VAAHGTHVTASAHLAGSHGQPDRIWLDAELERLELLVPALDHAATRGLVPTALAYVERYRMDVLQLGHEWDLLVAAVLDARRAGQHASVVQLVAGLALPAGRRSTFVEAESILRLGLVASRRLGDVRQYASFSMHLGCLLFAHGRPREGQRLWHAGVRLAQSKDSPSCPWEPLATFALVADLLEEQATAQRFTEVALRSADSNDTDSATAAIFLRGLYARRRLDLDRAYADLSHCVRLLARDPPTDGPSPQRQLFMATAQAELARVQGDDARACAYAETAITLAQAFADHYTIAALLIDQARYAYWRGCFLVARSAYCRLREASRETLKLPIGEHASRFLAREMASILPADLTCEGGRPLVTSLDVPAPASTLEHSSQAPREPLSEREAEVLRLVAAGLANREVAERLVVTPATVKKHLEHIYTKLGVHSRTAAVATARVLGVLP
jgi:DNA-binding CsgD family transcriptional regulator